MELKKITKRQEEILGVIVESYIGTISPVGSKMIADVYPTDISSATIRNEMAELESMDLITHPHTSAGRVPTDRGYRYYVDSIMNVTSVDKTEAALVAWEFRQKIKGIEDLIERTSHVLSSLTEQAAWVLYPNFRELILKRIELISYGHSHLLVVYATESGLVSHEMVDMEESLPEAELERLNHFMNVELAGKLLAEISNYLAERLAHVRDSAAALYRSALSVSNCLFNRDGDRQIILDGSRYILKQPEFRSTDKTKRLCRLLESQEALREVFPQHLEQSKISIYIGRENMREEIWDCSLVTSEYYFQDQPLGTLGVLGPRRMPYARVVAVVDYIGRRLTDAIEAFI